MIPIAGSPCCRLTDDEIGQMLLIDHGRAVAIQQSLRSPVHSASTPYHAKPTRTFEWMPNITKLDMPTHDAAFNSTTFHHASSNAGSS